MKDWLKIIGTLLAGVGTIAAAVATKLSFITLVVLVICEVVGAISIGWWCVGIPAIMLFGGLFLTLALAFTTALLADTL